MDECGALNEWLAVAPRAQAVCSHVGAPLSTSRTSRTAHCADVTDAVLNGLERKGVRVRTYALAPGAVVPCEVWSDDELMVLRLRGDFDSASEFTLSQRVSGTELVHVTGQVVPSSYGEVIYTMTAATIRHRPVVNVHVLLTAVEAGKERPVGSCTLVHGGHLHR